MKPRATRSLTMRPMLPADAPLLAVIFRASVEELGPEDYSPAQVEAWAAAADDEAAFAAALDTLAERPDLRKAIGRANREKAAAEYDEKDMIARYAKLYGEAIGAPGAFISNAQ